MPEVVWPAVERIHHRKEAAPRGVASLFMNAELALSTRWNTGRHGNGEALIAEILELGFRKVELGYDLTLDLVPGVRAMVADGSVAVGSVHNFCPVPPDMPNGHPELFALASPDPQTRANAVRHTANTVRFAAEMGARVVIVHAGRVSMRNRTVKLAQLAERGRRDSPAYERTFVKAVAERDRARDRHRDALYAALDALQPTLAANRVALALENLPSWEAFPSEPEILELVRRYDNGSLRYWHDFGHAGIRDRMGFADSAVWLDKLAFGLAGFHIHESRGTRDVHSLPPSEKTVFSALNTRPDSDTLLVFEPSPNADRESLRQGRALFDRMAMPLSAAN